MKHSLLLTTFIISTIMLSYKCDVIDQIAQHFNKIRDNIAKLQESNNQSSYRLENLTRKFKETTDEMKLKTITTDEFEYSINSIRDKSTIKYNNIKNDLLKLQIKSMNYNNKVQTQLANDRQVTTEIEFTKNELSLINQKWTSVIKDAYGYTSGLTRFKSIYKFYFSKFWYYQTKDVVKDNQKYYKLSNGLLFRIS